MRKTETKTITKFDFNGLYEDLKTLHADIRNQVCNTCDWSEATFYRKFKSTRPYSKAERIAIAGVCNDLVKKILGKIPQP